MPQRIGAISYEKDGSIFLASWKHFSGPSILPTLLVVPLLVAMEYAWCVVCVLAAKNAIQDPEQSIIVLTIFVAIPCAIFPCVLVFLLFYRENFCLDRQGLHRERNLLFWTWIKQVPLDDLRPFEYNFRNYKGRTTYSLLIVFQQENHKRNRTDTIKSPFGMCWSESEMQNFCDELNRFLETLRH